MPGGTRVYVGDLGDRGSRTELEREFSKYGRLREVWVARNPPGFAFVFFDDPRDAEDAVQGMDGRFCCGVRIRVEMARGDTRDRPKYGPKCYECGRIGHSGRECTRRPGYQYRGKNASIRDRRSSYRSRSRSKDRKSGRRSRSRSRSGERKRSKRRSASPERSRSTSPVRRSRSRSADRRSSSPSKDARRRSRSVGRRSLSRSRSRSVSQERKRKSQSTEVKRSRSLSRSPSKERDENANESGGKDDKGSASDEGSNVIKPEDY